MLEYVRERELWKETWSNHVKLEVINSNLKKINQPSSDILNLRVKRPKPLAVWITINCGKF